MATNITWHPNLTHQERAELRKQQGVTVWLTGLSASGKSTIACALEQSILNRGLNSYRLDGDNVRFGLNKDLGFSEQDRNENIRRISEVAKLFSDSCCVTVTSFISPYKADRNLARELHAKDNLPFVEVYVDVPIEVAEQRDPKGLYKRQEKVLLKNLLVLVHLMKHQKIQKFISRTIQDFQLRKLLNKLSIIFWKRNTSIRVTPYTQTHRSHTNLYLFMA